MTKRLTLLLLVAAAAFVATAQTARPARLSHPLNYLPADSVMFFNQGDNWRLTALVTDSTVRPEPYAPLHRHAFKKQEADWEARCRDSLNLVGGTGDEQTDPQTAAALRTLDTSARLFLTTGDARYVEALERALTNAVDAGARRDTSATLRRAAARALISAPALIYATGSDGLYVNLFTDCYARFDTPVFQGAIDQVTDMPTTGDVVLRLTPKRNGTPLTLRIRLPQWAAGEVIPASRYDAGARTPLPTVYVNGKDLLTSTTERGYLVIRREWNRNDEVRLTFPLPVLPVSPATSGSDGVRPVALMRGPVAYSGATLPAGRALRASHSPEPDFARAGMDFVPLAGSSVPLSGGTNRNDAEDTGFVAVPYAYFPPHATGRPVLWWPALP